VVLNVDDYDPGRYARSQVLRAAGFTVHEASSGADALRLTVAEKPDLVILDVNLPDISGLEVCRRLKADPATARVPVLHLSATFVGARHRALGLEGGADGYLTEPVEPPVLVATVNALLRARRAEEALRESARQWQATFDAMADGVAILNATGTVLQCNVVFPALFGRTASDVVGRGVGELWQGAAPPVEGFPFERLLRTRQRERAELKLGERWYQVTADPVVAEAGDLIGAAYIVEDVTARVRAEDERRGLLARETAARAEAESANRAKDEFLAVLSHELRAPLNAMLGWARLLQRGGLGPAVTRQALETIERNIRLQGQLVNDLLDVSRIVAHKLSLEIGPVDLGAVVRDALDGVRPAATAKLLQLHVSVAGIGGVVIGDGARLQQVVGNLLSNAVKFTPAGGRVSVRVERIGSRARIVVADTGQGITPQFIPYVFERFRQGDTGTARTHGGLGLGLAIARHLVELHGGAIQVESEGAGRGATFTVELPVTDQEPAAGGAGGAPTPAARRPGGLPDLRFAHVLVVDDQLDSAEMLRVALVQCGARVTVAAGAASAHLVLANDRPDVLVSDIGMPGQDGYELMRALRARPAAEGGGIPGVALTAYAGREDEGRALAAGYQHYVSKPVDPVELAGIVAGLLRRSPTGVSSGGAPTARAQEEP
jgi:PAS domain S-box-containing protein